MILEILQSYLGIESWFSKFADEELGIFYSADIIKLGFNDWISNGMHKN